MGPKINTVKEQLGGNRDIQGKGNLTNTDQIKEIRSNMAFKKQDRLLFFKKNVQRIKIFSWKLKTGQQKLKFQQELEDKIKSLRKQIKQMESKWERKDKKIIGPIQEVRPLTNNSSTKQKQRKRKNNSPIK